MKHINIPCKKLKHLPKNLPEIIDGYFICYNNELTSLKGAPRIVGRDLYCYGNELTSLKGSPRIVGRDLYFWHNRLISLDFLPLKFMRIVKTISEL